MNNELIIGGVCVAVVCGVEAFIFGKKIKKLTDEVEHVKGQVINDISSNLNIDVPNEFIDAAVNKAVDREAKERIRFATMEVTSDIRKDIKKQVSEAVDHSYKDIQGEVKRELLNQLGDVSVERIRREVIEEAKDKASKQFDKDLEEVLEKHNRELDKVTEIYSSIAKSMRGEK